MWKLLVAILLLAWATSPGMAQSRDASTYLQGCTGTDVSDKDFCEYTRETIPETLRSAWEGDYQAVRNLSYCLSTGCGGATKIDPREGCAWRAIAYGLAPTGDEKLLEADAIKAFCSAVNKTAVKAFVDAITQMSGRK